MFPRKKRPASALAAPAAAAAIASEPTATERAAAVEVELTGARDDLAAAQADLAAAQAGYDAAIDKADIVGALAARPRIAEATTVVEVAQRLVERLAADHAAACDGTRSAAELAERERLREAAEAAMRLYETAFRSEMPEVVARVRSVLRLWAVAELAREAAGAKGVALPRVDAFRDLPGRPREELQRRELDQWLNDWGGQPFGDADQARVKLQSDGTGTLAGPTHTSTASKKRRYLETTYRVAVPDRIAPVLAKELFLPTLYAGERAGYAPPTGGYGFSAKAVLAALDAAEQAQNVRPAEPEIRIERKALEPARDVSKKHEPRVAEGYRRIG